MRRGRLTLIHTDFPLLVGCVDTTLQHGRSGRDRRESVSPLVMSWRILTESGSRI